MKNVSKRTLSMVAISAVFALTATGAAPQITQDLNLKQVRSAIKYFRADLPDFEPKNELLLFGKVPESCKGFFKIKNSNPNDPNFDESLVREGFLNIRITDEDGKGRSCMKEKSCGSKDEKCISISEIEGGKISVPDEDVKIALATIDPEKDGAESLSSEVLSDSKGKPIVIVSNETRTKAEIEKAKNVVANCAEDATKTDEVIGSLDVLFRAGQIDEDEYDKVQSVVQDARLKAIITAAVETPTDELSAVVEDLIEWHSDNQRRPEDVSGALILVAKRLVADVELGMDRFTDADAVIAMAEKLRGLKPNRKTELGIARESLAIDKAYILAQQGAEARDDLMSLMYGSAYKKSSYWFYNPRTNDGLVGRAQRRKDSCTAQGGATCDAAVKNYSTLMFAAKTFNDIIQKQQEEEAKQWADMRAKEMSRFQNPQPGQPNPISPDAQNPGITEYKPLFLNIKTQ